MGLQTFFQKLNPFLPDSNLETPLEVVSSNIRSLGYDPKRALLRVQFKNGGLYEYEKVPYTTYKKMTQSDSKGKFFHQKVRGKYEVEKLAKRTVGLGIEIYKEGASAPIPSYRDVQRSIQVLNRASESALNDGISAYQYISPHLKERETSAKGLAKKWIRNKQRPLNQKENFLPELKGLIIPLKA